MHLNEVYVKTSGQIYDLWRAVDHKGEVRGAYVIETQDKAGALKLIKKTMKRHDRAEAIITDGLRSYGAFMKALSAPDLPAPVGR